MATIVEQRANKVLDVQFNYGKYGILSRREFMQVCKVRGLEVISITDRNYAAEEKEQAWLKANAWSHPWGNDRHPQTIAYNDRKAKLKEGIYKTEYRACEKDGTRHVITKIEFEYFKTL